MRITECLFSITENSFFFSVKGNNTCIIIYITNMSLSLVMCVSVMIDNVPLNNHLLYEMNVLLKLGN